MTASVRPGREEGAARAVQVVPERTSTVTRTAARRQSAGGADVNGGSRGGPVVTIMRAASGGKARSQPGEPGLVHHSPFTPKGLCPTAQGRRSGRTLGNL